jgi:hypothetical protein
MTRDDRPKDPPGEAPDLEDDPDRAAILARRQRFVALALSGLATSCTPRSQPQPCLDVMPPQEPVDPEPQPCLKVAAPEPQPQPETQPHPETQPQPEPEPRPQPCLKVAPPPEPKTEPAPQPCLNVVRPRDPEPAPKPEPRPCLKVARPK